MSATIKDVARRAGVSTATVSRVLNNVGSVDDRTRRRVEEATRELRYSPSPIGRSLSTRRTDAIGMLLPDLCGQFFSEMIRGSDQTAQEHHHHLLLSSSHSNREELTAALRTIRGRVDGLIIMSPHVDAWTLYEDLPLSVPAVLLSCHVEGEDFESINVDNFNGAVQMVRHLISHGHRRIAIIKGTEKNFDAEERLRGYRFAMGELNGENTHELEFPGTFSEASGYEAVRKMLRLPRRPTAIFASNDATAIGAMSALREAGIQMPKEMAVVGFDDIPIAAYVTPSLTTVSCSISDLGALAVNRLIDAVREKNNHVKQQTVLPFRLALRDSCGCRAQVSRRVSGAGRVSRSTASRSSDLEF
jgi:LacI family transcriptional regulator, galactose operon repressor